MRERTKEEEKRECEEEGCSGEVKYNIHSSVTKGPREDCWGEREDGRQCSADRGQAYRCTCFLTHSDQKKVKEKRREEERQVNLVINLTVCDVAVRLKVR